MRRIKICPWCGQKFHIHPRLGPKQVSCGQPVCKNKQKNQSQARWKARNNDVYRASQKDWRRHNPDYWKNYRASHPQYTANNRRQAKIRKTLSAKKTGGLQKRIDILQPCEKQMEFWNLPRFAKESRSLTPLLYAIYRSCENKNQTKCLC